MKAHDWVTKVEETTPTEPGSRETEEQPGREAEEEEREDGEQQQQEDRVTRGGEEEKDGDQNPVQVRLQQQPTVSSEGIHLFTLCLSLSSVCLPLISGQSG